MAYKPIHSIDDMIKDVAYRLWQEAGEPTGNNDHFWYAAENLARYYGFDLEYERHRQPDNIPRGYYYFNHPTNLNM